MKTLGFIFLVCLLSAPSAFGQQTANLRDVKMLDVELAPLSQVDHEIGLSEDSVRSFVLAKLGNELPEIDVDLARNDFILFRILSVKVNESSVASYVSVELGRYVSILRDEDGQVVGNAVATVWGNGAMLAGSAEEMGSKIQAEIGRQITAFATEYHRQNRQDSANAPADICSA